MTIEKQFAKIREKESLIRWNFDSELYYWNLVARFFVAKIKR